MRVTNYATKYDLHLLHCLWATDKISSSSSWSFSRAHSIDIMHFAKTISSPYDFLSIQFVQNRRIFTSHQYIKWYEKHVDKNAIFHLTKYTEHFN